MDQPREQLVSGAGPSTGVPYFSLSRPQLEGSQNGQNKRRRIERPRPPLSCTECKRKKVKCDRQLPCNQCKKLVDNNKAAHCIYANVPASVSPVPEVSRAAEYRDGAQLTAATTSSGVPQPMSTPSSTSSFNAVEDLQQRVLRIEHQLAIQSEARMSGVSHMLTPEPTPNQKGVLSVKGDRSRYGSIAFKLSLLNNNFQEIHAWIQKGSNDPTVRAMRHDFRAYQKAFARGQKCVLAEQCIRGSTITEDILKAIGPHSSWARLSDIYWENFEHGFRILHGPSFYRTLRRLEDCAEETRAATFATFVPQLALVLLIASGLDETDSFVREKITATPAPQCFIDIVEAWLEKQPRKARSEVSYLRTQCLLLLAMQIHQAPIDKQWSLSGSLVKSATLMGLHQNPSQFASLSMFQGELRRKLWFTIVELDLQISIQLGVAPSVRCGDYNTRPPSNINDFDLHEDMTALNLNPADEFTNASCQIALAQSLPYRMEALQLAYNVTVDPAYSQVVRLGRRIESFLDKLPACLRMESNDPARETEQKFGRTFNLMLLDIFLKGALLALYLPYALHSNSSPKRPFEETIFNEATTAHTSGSVRVLSTLKYLRTPPISPLSIRTNPSKTRFCTLFYRLCNTAIITAALTTSLRIRATPPSEHESRDNLISLVACTADHLISLLPTPDGSLCETTALSLVLADVTTPASTSTKAEHEARLQEATDMVLAECQKQLGPPPSEDSTPMQQQQNGPQLVNGDEGMLGNGSVEVYDGGAEFMGAEGMDFGSGFGLDWDIGLSWI